MHNGSSVVATGLPLGGVKRGQPEIVAVALLRLGRVSRAETGPRKSLGGLALIAGGASGYMVAGLKGITR
jgi:hypothetical protein